MKSIARDGRAPAELVLDSARATRATRAMRAAVRDALLAHKRDGDPIVVWRDGHAVWVPADEIGIPLVDDEPPAK
jgi:hypothetical protein